MTPRPTCPPLLFALALSGLLAAPAWAAVDNDYLVQELRRLAERVEQLEAANKRLEAALGEASADRAKEAAARGRETDNAVQDGVPAADRFPALEGISAGASLVMVAQRAIGGTLDGKDESQLNYRADVEVELPGGTIGNAAGKIFAHVRLGQGGGLANLNPTLTGSVNSVGFELENGGVAASDDSVALLAQAWYQLDIPVGAGVSGPVGRVELTVGKIDPFVFFDGNTIADDESEAFLNNVFVHNPLLDSGGDAGVDTYGFTPGMRLAYLRELDGANSWGLSLGVFGSGAGAHFDTSFTRPFLIAQAEYHKALGGLTGGYRLYAWSNGRAANLDESAEERHDGWGVSIDQQLTEQVTLFTRIGLSTRGETAFDRALTLGGQLGGAGWGRENDRVGLAFGWLGTSDDYRAANPGFSGAEKQVELFYAWQLNDKLHLSPGVQWISRPGGDPAADSISVLSLRAKAAF